MIVLTCDLSHGGESQTPERQHTTDVRNQINSVKIRNPDPYRTVYVAQQARIHLYCCYRTTSIKRSAAGVFKIAGGKCTISKWQYPHSCIGRAFVKRGRRVYHLSVLTIEFLGTRRMRLPLLIAWRSLQCVIVGLSRACRFNTRDNRHLRDLSTIKPI